MPAQMKRKEGIQLGMCVCNGSILSCSCGTSPSSLSVLPQNKVIVSGLPVADIMANIPMVNILPFGMCQSMANPTVAAATAAASGVLTPMPCIPVTVSPWTPGSPTVTLANVPALNNTSCLLCAWGGTIQISSPGQTNVQVL